MQLDQSKEEDNFDRIKSWIINPSEHRVKKWSRFFRRIDSLGEQKKGELQKLLEIQNNPYLIYLSNYHDHAELQRAQTPYDEGTRIITKESSTTIAIPFSPQRIALNDTGTALALSYGNTLKVISKKKHWGAEVYEKTDRVAVESMAFTDPQNLALCTELQHYSLNLQTKDRKYSLIGEITPYKKPLISHNGKWLMYYSTEHNYSLCFRNLESNHTFGMPIAEKAFQDLRFNSFAADENGEYFALTAPMGLVMANLTVREHTDFKIIYKHLNERTHQLVDCDIGLNGQKAATVGQNILCLYTKNDSGDLDQTEIPFSSELYASRFHPLDDSIILATSDGVVLYDMTQHTSLTVLENPVKLISLSSNGHTLAAASAYALFIIDSLQTKKNISLEEHLLIKRLSTEEPEQVLGQKKFLTIFKSIKNAHVQQKLVKAFNLDYTKYGYTDCPVCRENFSNIRLNCAHTFCGDCIEQWESEGKNTCPLCRAQISVKRRKK
jgi:hypothetical protein